MDFAVSSHDVGDVRGGREGGEDPGGVPGTIGFGLDRIHGLWLFIFMVILRSELVVRWQCRSRAVRTLGLLERGSVVTPRGHVTLVRIHESGFLGIAETAVFVSIPAVFGSVARIRAGRGVLHAGHQATNGG